MMVMDQPMVNVTVHEHVLPETILNEIEIEAEALASCEENHWVPLSTCTLQEEPQSPAEAAVAALYPLVKEALPSNIPIEGAEYWVQIYESGRGLSFHFDKDESKMAKENIVVNPLLSSVLYLTGASNQPLQSPTVINDQYFDQKQKKTVPEDPTCSTFVFPFRNSYCVFDGRLGHGVIDSRNTDRRITMLVNWWKERPQLVLRRSMKTKGTYKCSYNLREENDVCKEEQNVVCHEVTVTSKEIHDEYGYLTIDDLLKERKIKPRPGEIVTFRHLGLNIYPIDADQLQNAPQEQSLQIGALLLPCEE